MRTAIFALAATAAMAAEVTVVYRIEKATGARSLSIQDSDSKVLADTCHHTLGALDFQTDENGAGLFTSGDKSFDITAGAQGGVDCNRIYSGDITVVECNNVPIDDVPIDNTPDADCFHHESTKREFHDLSKRSAALKAMDASKAALKARAPAPVSKADAKQPFRMHARQLGVCNPKDGHVLSGDGSPRDVFLHRQLTDPIACESATSCNVGDTESESVSFDFSITGTSKGGFFSGGFGVSASFTTGKVYGCAGTKQETVCMWYKTAYKKYKGYEAISHGCINSPMEAVGDELEWNSPINDNPGGGRYCVINTCRTKDEEYWQE